MQTMLIDENKLNKKLDDLNMTLPGARPWIVMVGTEIIGNKDSELEVKIFLSPKTGEIRLFDVRTFQVESDGAGE